MSKFNDLERFEDERNEKSPVTTFVLRDLELQVDSFEYEYGETQAVIQFDAEVFISNYSAKKERVESIEIMRPYVFLIDQDGGEFAERKLDTVKYDKQLEFVVMQTLKSKRII